MARGAPKIIPGPDGSPERYNIAAVAARCGVSTQTVYGWVNEGRLAASKVGPKLWWVYQADLDAFLGGSRAAGAPAAPEPVDAGSVAQEPTPDPVQAPGVPLSDIFAALSPDTPLGVINVKGLPAPEKPAAAPSRGSVPPGAASPVRKPNRPAGKSPKQWSKKRG